VYWWLGVAATKPPTRPEDGDGVWSRHVGKPSHPDAALCPRIFHWSHNVLLSRIQDRTFVAITYIKLPSAIVIRTGYVTPRVLAYVRLYFGGTPGRIPAADGLIWYLSWFFSINSSYQAWILKQATIKLSTPTFRSDPTTYHSTHSVMGNIQLRNSSRTRQSSRHAFCGPHIGYFRPLSHRPLWFSCLWPTSHTCLSVHSGSHSSSRETRKYRMPQNTQHTPQYYLLLYPLISNCATYRRS